MGGERPTIDAIVADRLPALSPAEARTGPSDATVIRTARALGCGGMGNL